MRIAILAALGLMSAAATAQVGTTEQLEPGIATAFAAARVEATQILLTPPQTIKLNMVIRDLQLGKNEKALARWGNLVTDISRVGNNVDVFALVQWVMRQSYIENIEDLRDRAERVRYNNSQKKTIRESIRRARTFRAVLRELNQPTDVLDAEIESLRAYVARLEEDDQLATLDLQNFLQKQQQLLQQMSNISKQLHETALSVIRSFKG